MGQSISFLAQLHRKASKQPPSSWDAEREHPFTSTHVSTTASLAVGASQTHQGTALHSHSWISLRIRQGKQISIHIAEISGGNMH